LQSLADREGKITFSPRHCEVRSNPQLAGNGLGCVELTLSRSWPRGASYFCRHKSNQKGLQQKGFFAAQAFTLQIDQNHGLQLFCPASPAISSASAKTCYALSYTQGHHCSARFHPKLLCCEKKRSIRIPISYLHQ
jgi:hypothetical protein